MLRWGGGGTHCPGSVGEGCRCCAGEEEVHTAPAVLARVAGADANVHQVRLRAKREI